MDFELNKLQQTLRSLEERAIEYSSPLAERLVAPNPSERHSPSAFLEACKELEFRSFARFERWGSAGETRVFKLSVTVPAELTGKSVNLRLTTGREDRYTAFSPQFLVYVDGELAHGMDINHTLLELAEAGEAGVTYEILIHAFAGTEPGLMDLCTEVVSINPEIMELVYAFRTALQAMALLSEGSGERAELRKALLDTADLLVFHAAGADFAQSVQAAKRYLNLSVYEKEWVANPVRVQGIGHTHIDIAWMWTVEQTRQKAQRSFSTVLQLMDRYPDYYFFSSQPILYQFVKEDNPELYARIKDRVREGRWEAEGGMWLEPDCNLPSGESLIRQIYYGKKFLKDEFEVDSQILWLPDSFGYSAVLPQLMRQSGLRYFVSSKLSWNEFTRIPHDVFEWEGMDGSRVLAYMITTPDDQGLPNSPDFSTYNATLQPKNVLGVWQRMLDKDVTRQVMMPYGFGDGGGGPTEEMLEAGLYMNQGLPGLPVFKTGRVDDFFENLEQEIGQTRQLPRYNGELYLEFHRGTYTSVGKMKQINRRAEILLNALELVLSYAGGDSPEARERLWKTVLLGQFHDVLTGSAIKEVFSEVKEDYADFFSRGERILNSSMKRIAAGSDEALVVINPNAGTSDTVLFLEDLAGRQPVRNGEALPAQQLADGRVAVYVDRLPGLSLSTYGLEDMSELPSDPDLSVSASHLENRFFSIDIDENGELSSIYDKREGRELLLSGSTGNAWLLYEDRPAVNDAWNIDVSYTDKVYPVRTADRILVSEEGPICAAVTVQRSFLNSSSVQTIRIYRDLPRIDFETEVDWHESQMLLKASFPVDIHALDAECGMQYGSVRRPIHPNTQWEEARFEVYAHNYVDLSERDYGVSLLTGDKYGVDFRDGAINLTLLKAPIDPWDGADEGTHRFTYNLYPHAGDAHQANVYAVSRQSRILAGIQAELEADLEWSFASCDQSNIMVDAVKPAEDGRGIIVRLSEQANRRTVTALELDRSPAAAWSCDLLENNQAPLDVQGSKLELTFKPYEIKTIRVEYQE